MAKIQDRMDADSEIKSEATRSFLTQMLKKERKIGKGIRKWPCQDKIKVISACRATTKKKKTNSDYEKSNRIDRQVSDGYETKIHANKEKLWKFKWPFYEQIWSPKKRCETI